MAAETLSDLVWKMECKGYDSFEIRIWIEGIWCIVAHINEQLDRFFGNIHDYDRRVNELKEFV